MLWFIAVAVATGAALWGAVRIERGLGPGPADDGGPASAGKARRCRARQRMPAARCRGLPCDRRPRAPAAKPVLAPPGWLSAGRCTATRASSTRDFSARDLMRVRALPPSLRPDAIRPAIRPSQSAGDRPRWAGPRTSWMLDVGGAWTRDADQQSKAPRASGPHGMPGARGKVDRAAWSPGESQERSQTLIFRRRRSGHHHGDAFPLAVWRHDHL